MPRGAKPGERRGGRTAGTPNKATREIKAAARLMVEKPAYRAELEKRILEGKAPHMETLLFHYAYGKPKEGEVSGAIKLVMSWQ